MQSFSQSPLVVLAKALQALADFSVQEMNLLRPRQDGAALRWTLHTIHLMKQCITAHTDCNLLGNHAGKPPTRKLLVAKFTTPALDKVSIGKTLHDCQQYTSAHYRESAGGPLLVFKYDEPIGRQCINTKRYADLPQDAMATICETDCNCHLIDDRFKLKHDGHLLTTSPLILPSPQLQQIARLGRKCRPSPFPRVYTSATKQELQSVLRGPITIHAIHADNVERRVGMKHCMSAWTSHVLEALNAALDATPEGTPLPPSARIQLGVGYPTLHMTRGTCKGAHKLLPASQPTAC